MHSRTDSGHFGVSTDGQGNYVLKWPVTTFARLTQKAQDLQGEDGKYLVCGMFTTLWPSMIERLEYRIVDNREVWITIFEKEKHHAEPIQQAESGEPDQVGETASQGPASSGTG